MTAADKGVIGAVCLRVFNAAEALGVGKAVLRRAAGYAATRVVFGRPTGANQGISLPLAEAHARLTAAELAIRRAAWRIDNDQTTRDAASSLT
jgi:acyl-CoA dehydrogenase